MDLYALTTQETLERISRHCPEAMTAYLHCFNRVDNYGRIHFTKEMIEVDMSENFTSFKSAIKKLARENLLAWRPDPAGILVTMADTLDE